MSRDRRIDYLIAIFRCGEEGKANTKDVADIVGVAQPTAVSMFKRLAEDGYVEYEKYRGAELTREGKKLAHTGDMRRKVFRRLFMLLGFDEKRSEDLSGCVSGDLPRECVFKLDEFLDFLREAKVEEKWERKKGNNG